MATTEALVPTGSTTLPNAGEGRLLNNFGMSKSEADAVAKRVVEDHRKGKEAAFGRMLTAQKYAYHIDGEGDGQWADLVGGRQVRIPRRRKGALRHQDNILRPMVDYWVAYFTSQNLHCVAEHRDDRKSRDRARIDSTVGNHHLRDQRVNDKAAMALYMAAFNGWGILHSMWRNDVVQDGTETAGVPYNKRIVHPGFTDLFPGNPFDTVFAPSSFRSSFPWYSYGRTIPTSVVQQAFPDVPGIEKLEGSEEEASTSWFQRMLRQWESLFTMSGGAHGSAALTGSGTENNLALICREILPGQLRAYPGGANIIVGLKGASNTGGYEGQQGEPILLHVGPLPGGVPSGTLFYALSRGDDINGKAYVADLDDDQVRLNQAITMYAEILSQLAYPQLFVAQGTQLLANQTIGDKIIEYISSPGQPAPQYQYPGSGVNYVAILKYIQDIRESAFRKGGWQASSRGEASGANEPAARAQFLAAQDKMIFAPTALAFRSSVIDVLRKNHALRKEFQNLPLLVEEVGDALGYMAGAYIHKSDMSPRPPNFSLVSGFGASSEQRLAQLDQMVVMRDGAGQPILTAKRYWQLHPDAALRPDDPDVDEVRRRRAHAINLEVERVVEELRETQPQIPPSGFPGQAEQLAAQVRERYPPTWTDGFALPLFVDSLDVLVQDPAADQLVAAVAADLQKYLLEWQQAASGQMDVQPGTDEAPANAGAVPQ